MRRTVSRFLAASLLLAGLAVHAATRPRYGGTLRIELRASPNTLDPADRNSAAYLTSLLFDELVGVSNDGSPAPRLARAWQHSDDFKHWRFTLRPGLKLDDGSTLTSAAVASAFQTTAPELRVKAAGDDIVIDSDTPRPALLAELALPRHAIAIRRPDGSFAGAGPFRVANFQPGRHAELRANDFAWAGRPFLDVIQIDFNRNLREQALDFDLGKTDAVEVSPEQVRRLAQDGKRVSVSSPIDLLAISFDLRRAPASDPRLRQGIALAIDRAAIQTALLQRQGEVAGGLLPQWVSGYAFLFPTAVDLTTARQLRNQVAAFAPLTLAYDPADPLSRAIAERIAVNARDINVTVQPSGNGSADMSLVRIPLVSPAAAGALANVAASLDLGAVAAPTAPDQLYAAERDLLAPAQIIPLLHLPEAFVLAPRVRNWSEPSAGGLPLADVWVEGER